MNEEWKRGWNDGYVFATNNWNPRTGYYKTDLPSEFVHRGDSWSCGYGEGLISARSELMRLTFPGFKSISWPNGKVKVEY